MALNLEREIQSVKDRVDKLTTGQKYVIKTDENKRDLDAVNGTLQELAVFVATLAKDLQKQRILK